MKIQSDIFDVGRFLSENDLESVPEKVRPEKAAPTEHERHWDMPGFHGKARVSTTFGDLPLMALRVRDKVRTISGEYKPVKWIDEVRLDAAFLEGSPEAQPIRIGQGALGANSPVVDILVSPAQQLSFKTEWGRRTAKAAIELLNRPKFTRAHQTSLSYFLFHCGDAEIVQIDGIWCHVSP